MRKGFTIIELVIAIAILGGFATVALTTLNPFEQLARARDSARTSGLTQIGQALAAYSITHAEYFPAESSHWMSDLVSGNELKYELPSVRYSKGDTSPCTINEQNHYCYEATTPDGAGPVVVYASMEATTSFNRCDAGQTAYAVYSTADGREGIVCTATNSTPLPGSQQFSDSGTDPCVNAKGNVQVISPNGGEIYTPGGTIDITWCLNNYSAYNQANSFVWLASRQTQADGTYVYQNQKQIAQQVLMHQGANSLSWTIPDLTANGGSYVIFVAINSFNPNYDYSNATFTISATAASSKPSLTCTGATGPVQVISPNGGETFTPGGTMHITWCVNDYSQYNQTYASIWLSSRQTQSNGTYGYQNQIKIADNLVMQTGANSLDWAVPDLTANGGSYVIFVAINSFNPNYDYSDGTFTISATGASPPASSNCTGSTGPIQVISPNGGESFTPGGTIAITWCVNDFSQYNQSYASIWLSSRQTQTNGTYVYQNQVQIAANPVMVAGQNTYTWNIPSTLATAGSYVILVSINSFNPNYDYSNGTFTIGAAPPPPSSGTCTNSPGTVQVTYPNGGETFHHGTTMHITWCVNDYSQYNQTYSSIWLSSRQTQSNGTYVYQNATKISDMVAMQPGSNSFDWTVPDSYTYTYFDPPSNSYKTVTVPINGGSYVILVNINSFNPNYDYSDNPFSIGP